MRDYSAHTENGMPSEAEIGTRTILLSRNPRWQSASTLAPGQTLTVCILHIYSIIALSKPSRMKYFKMSVPLKDIENLVILS